VAFEGGSGDVIIVFVGDKMALSRVSFLDGVLLFVGCWREGDLVCNEKKETCSISKYSGIVFYDREGGKKKAQTNQYPIYCADICRCRFQFSFYFFFLRFHHEQLKLNVRMI
jgi:hypothetical protein